MKRILLSILLLTLLSAYSSAGFSSLFSYDAVGLERDMTELQLLEDYVLANPGINLNALQVRQNILINDLNLTANSCRGFNSSQEGDPLLGMPAYYWGCCLGLPGLLFVFAVADNDEQTNRAFWGCFYNLDFWLSMWLIWYYMGYAYY